MGNPEQTSASSPLISVSDCIDVLGVLQTTTRTIRSVRNYVITLPDESTGTLRSQYRNKKATGDLINRHKSKNPQPDPF